MKKIVFSHTMKRDSQQRSNTCSVIGGFYLLLDVLLSDREIGFT